MTILSSATSVAVRPATEADREFLHRVFVATREPEFRLLRLDPESMSRLLRQQFEAQHAYYHEHYTDADYLVIEHDHVPAGRFYVDYASDPMVLIEIALLPEHRHSGIGTRLVENLTQRADSDGRVISLHVEPNNPARRLYERFGFVPVDSTEIYLRMERSPKS